MELLAHGGEIVTSSEILAFNSHLDLLLVIGVIAVGYYWGIPRLAARHAPRGEPAVTVSQKLLFGLGLVLWVLPGLLLVVLGGLIGFKVYRKSGEGGVQESAPATSPDQLSRIEGDLKRFEAED